jgi:hypothetical protein
MSAVFAPRRPATTTHANSRGKIVCSATLSARQHSSNDGANLRRLKNGANKKSEEIRHAHLEPSGNAVPTGSTAQQQQPASQHDLLGLDGSQFLNIDVLKSANFEDLLVM